MTAMTTPSVSPAGEAGPFTVHAETAEGVVLLQSCCCVHSARAAVDQLSRFQRGDWVIMGPDEAGVVAPRGWASSSGPMGADDDGAPFGLW
jgi:hypothetical protein